MVATSAPFGFAPKYHPSGIVRPRALAAGLPSAYANSIYQYQPVLWLTTGFIQEVQNNSSELIGTFMGASYTPTGGRPAIANYWPAATAASDITVYFSDDPWIEYDIQADGSVAQTGLAGGTSFTNLTAGSTLTGLSQCTATATIAGSGNSQLRIVNLGAGTGVLTNAWGDAFTVLRVLIGTHQYVGNKAVI